MKTEESKTRLPDFGRTRGKIIFRFNHEEQSKTNDQGKVETYWTCDYVLVDNRDRDIIINAILEAEYSTGQEMALINNVLSAIVDGKSASQKYVGEYKAYQVKRAAAKTVVDAAL